MKARTLALRVTLNSVVMIAAVYLLMQTVVYFRDSLLLQTAALSDFVPTVFGFLGGRVLPPLVVFGVLLWALALPIQKTTERLESGERLSEVEIEKTRGRILRFKGIVLAVNLIGFTVGFLLDLVLGNKLAELAQVHRLIILGANLAGAFSYAAAQTALDNVAFAPLRDRLGITAIGARKKEASSTSRQIRLTAILALYSALVVQYNQWDVATFQSWGTEVLAQVKDGKLAATDAPAAYRELVASRLALVSSRDPALVKDAPLPWDAEGRPQDIHERVFLLMFALMFAIVFGVQAAVSREHRSWLSSLRGRIHDVVEGGGDLRSRLSLRSMDDLGELAELVNRLLDQFQTIVGRIGAAAGQTREGAQAVEAVLGRAEAVSAQVGASVVALRQELEVQSEQARVLGESLWAFREAAEAVDAEAKNQAKFVAETSSAMDALADSIQAVRDQSRQAGELTEALAQQGEGGGQAVTETSQAIGGIHTASQEVLRVLGSLKKIAADTNLLAMNASIEAAHAGDRGAGFAVVADEVRKLAVTAATQAQAIQDLIKAMARQVEAGVERARRSGQVLQELVEGLHNSARVSSSVAASMDQQTGHTRGVSGSLGQVVATSDAIRAKMVTQAETTGRMAGSVERTLDRLATLVETSRRQAEAVASLEASFAEVRREVDRNAAAAETLRTEIGRFQV